MCVNTPGSFMCICKTGYIRIDDYSCTGKCCLLESVFPVLGSFFLNFKEVSHKCFLITKDKVETITS